MKFIDEVNILVASGKGGPGSISFRREAKMAMGGPDGGDGGKGGDVVFQVNPQMNTLVHFQFQKKHRAQDGEAGKGQKMSGAAGIDLVLQVPDGTVIKNEHGKIIFDLTDQAEHLLLKGGLGGKGNCYYKSSVNQAPMKAQSGLPGEELKVSLELKLIADVGIIGLPNAGKSTLISRISAAKPKIADYPFTTLTPNLGVVKISDERSFVVADIPGLIQGAHEGVGLGSQFLRHIERTRLFVHMIDASDFSGKEPLDAYMEIQAELKGYDNQKDNQIDFIPLGDRPQIVVLNKIDTIDEDRLDQIKTSFLEKKIEVFEISAVTGVNIKKLVFEINDQLLQTGSK